MVQVTTLKWQCWIRRRGSGYRMFADNVLTVSSKDSEPFKDSTEPEYVHKGIVFANSPKKFSLEDDVVVNDASMKNGMLTISMEKVVPEGKKKINKDCF